MSKQQYLSVIAAAAISLVTAAAQTPRLQDGKPNLNGYWQALNTANFDIQDHAARKGEPGGQGVVEGNEIPYRPWALEKKKENLNSRVSLDSEAKCYQLGV